jgi:hypothetical protein
MGERVVPDRQPGDIAVRVSSGMLGETKSSVVSFDPSFALVVSGIAMTTVWRSATRSRLPICAVRWNFGNG